MFIFELTRLPDPQPSGFDLGHVRIGVDRRSATSEGRNPDQAFMVFVTAADVLNHVAGILTDKRRRSATVICVDSSMRIDFRRPKKRQIEIGLGGEWLGIVPGDVLAATIFASVANLLAENPLEPSDTACRDLETAIEGFRPVLAVK